MLPAPQTLGQTETSAPKSLGGRAGRGLMVSGPERHYAGSANYLEKKIVKELEETRKFWKREGRAEHHTPQILSWMVISYFFT